MNEITYATPKDQVSKLISQNMIINDANYAEKQLKSCGYFNLIKSYRDPYMITENGKKVYREGITFEHVESLYILDKNLRNAVMSAMQDLEEHIKEAAADVISSSFGVHQDDYLKFRNYRDKAKKKKQFTLSGILRTMEKALDTDKDPIAHYVKEHNIVPPWILFKSVYFTTIVNFIHQFKPSEQKKMVMRLYDVDELNIPEEYMTRFMIASIFVCQEYRNIAAHGGRVFNYEPQNAPFIKEMDPSIHGLSILMLALRALKYKAPYNIVDAALTKELNRHCQQFPEDVTYLSSTLNLNIFTKKIAWTTNNGTKYHMNEHCSGIINAKEISLDEAASKGLKPCKKCCS